MKNKKTFKNICIAIISISSFLYSACGENNVSSGNSFQENGNLSISIMPENNQDNNEIIKRVVVGRDLSEEVSLM